MPETFRETVLTQKSTSMTPTSKAEESLTFEYREKFSSPKRRPDVTSQIPSSFPFHFRWFGLRISEVEIRLGHRYDE